MDYFIYLVLLTNYAQAEFYEDSRCSCVCLSPDSTGNHVRTFYQENYVAPEQCNCKDAVVPRVTTKVNVSWLTFCLQCECHFETRNTKMVMYFHFAHMHEDHYIQIQDMCHPHTNILAKEGSESQQWECIVVVILLCTIISILMVYMLCLKILEKIVIKRKTVTYSTADERELRVLLNETRSENSDLEDCNI